MKLLLYKGRSFISKAIQFQTRSEYSHVGIMLRDESIVEAWHVGGVQHCGVFDNHKSRTAIDVFGFRKSFKYDADQVEAFLLSQVGKKYDFSAVARFISRRDAPANDRWFCSELGLYAFEDSGSPLLRLNPSHGSPRDCSTTPYIRYEKTLYSY